MPLNSTESNKPRTMQEVFDASCTSCALPCGLARCISCINFKATNVTRARFTDHKKFNMEPVWLFGVISHQMDSALKKPCAFIQKKFLSWPALCMEISLHHVNHWPNQKQRIMICFSLLWVALIWITDVKIPQDVSKTISGHVVAKKMAC